MIQRSTNLKINNLTNNLKNEMIGKYNKILTIVTKYIQTQHIISQKKKSFPGMDLLLKYDKKREYFQAH